MLSLLKFRKNLEKKLKEQKRFKKRLAKLNKIGKFQINEIDGVKVADGLGLRLGHIFDGDGILIVDEIFNNQEYYFDCSSESIVIDIGMNIGLACLFFAQKDDVSDIYGFEPFKPTYEQALFNFDLNACYKNKIHPFNIGLGDKDELLKVDYYGRSPGKMSVIKSIDELHPDRKKKYDIKNQEVIIKNTSEVLMPIIEKHTNKKIILKCDTEGSEKKIFESLESSNLLSKIDIVMAEYHFSYDNDLLKILKGNGFVIFKQKIITLKTGDFGIIRAVRI